MRYPASEKLMGVFNKHVEALNKHRGKGQQNITVKHVNVEAGGQAIVGNVETGKSTSDSKETKPALDKPSEKPIDISPSRKSAKIKR